MKSLFMGNEAMGRGALDAGVSVVTGYPGTPSTEILEYIVREHKEGEKNNLSIQWSVNEKVAVEVAAGASITGSRALVTMKQVGLNVAADPVMNLGYIGTKGGLVLIVADDPGPISSQTEQDTRLFGKFSKIPVLDPTCPKRAYEMTLYAFELSEKYSCPVILRPTTRVCHSFESLETEKRLPKNPEIQMGYEKDSKWAIFPGLSYKNHLYINTIRDPKISDEFSSSGFNLMEKKKNKGIITSGVNHLYTKEALEDLDLTDLSYLNIGTSYPLPEKLILEYLEDLTEVLVVEELSPYLEDEITRLVGKYHLKVTIKGKRDHSLPSAGEYSVDLIKEGLSKWLGLELESEKLAIPQELQTINPPTMCSGCPHRGSFYSIKKATAGKKAVYTGDIGCYTLANAKPLDMVDTCLCMGAGFSMAQGINISTKDLVFAFIGDSTFFHSGMTGIVNAVYNQTDVVFVILDNRITAMTGCQPSISTGKTATLKETVDFDLTKVIHGLGVEDITILDPFELDKNIEKIQEISERDGVRVLIFDSPCVKISSKEPSFFIDENCIFCELCIKEIGCPSIEKIGEQIVIDETSCNGCGLCSKICPVEAIQGE